jgi:hypothetical protein
MDDEYVRAGEVDPRVMITTSRDPSSRLVQVFFIFFIFHPSWCDPSSRLVQFFCILFICIFHPCQDDHLVRPLLLPSTGKYVFTNVNFYYCYKIQRESQFRARA